MKKLLLICLLAISVNAQDIKPNVEQQKQLKDALIRTQAAVAAAEAAKTKAELENQKMMAMIYSIMAELKLSPKEYKIVLGEEGFSFAKKTSEEIQKESKLP